MKSFSEKMAVLHLVVLWLGFVYRGELWFCALCQPDLCRDCRGVQHPEVPLWFGYWMVSVIYLWRGSGFGSGVVDW